MCPNFPERNVRVSYYYFSQHDTEVHSWITSGKTQFLHVPSYCFVLQLIYFTFLNTTTMKIRHSLVGNCIHFTFKMVKLNLILCISLRHMAGTATSVFILNNGNAQRYVFLFPIRPLCHLWKIFLFHLMIRFGGPRTSLDSSENGQLFNRSRFLNNWISPCTKVIFEKLLVEQPFKKSPAFYGIRNFIPLFTSDHHWKQSWTGQIAWSQGISSHCRTSMFV